MNINIPGARFFSGKTVAILGLGISGRASVQALSEHTEAAITVWDAKESAIAPYSDQPRIVMAQAHSDSSELMDALIESAPDIVVIAPGFRQIGPEWERLRAAGIPVWSEIELAWHLRAQHPDGSFAPWLCITGTNGKTTTTTLLASILQVAGLRGVAVGNVGTPAVTAVSDTSVNAPRAFAFELSSFQLSATYSIEPLASICLNIADDHLEWHGERTAYRDAKANIYNRVHEACIYPVGDRVVQGMVDDADVRDGARAIGLVIGTPSVGEIGIVSVPDDKDAGSVHNVDGSATGVRLEHQLVVDRAFGNDRWESAQELFTFADLAHLAPQGMDLPLHIVKDAMAAAALARAAGVAPEHIRQGIRSFKAGKHRIENLGTVNGVRWIDDSKATNAHAAQASLLAQDEARVVWIAGGLAKGAQFDDLVERVRSRVSSVIVIGVDQSPWESALAGSKFPVHYVDPSSPQPMRDAVRYAAQIARQGDTVLLAPACASQDQFVSYADRGDQFAREVEELKHFQDGEA